MAQGYTIRLASVGNPDFRQFAPISDLVNSGGSTVAECVRVAMDYRDAWELGSGNWTNPRIVRADGSVVGYVSYNGRLWAEDTDLGAEDATDLDPAIAA